MEGLILTHREIPVRHALRQRRALFIRDGDQGFLQRYIEALVSTVAGADECRQPAQFKELAYHPHPGTALQGNSKMRRQQQLMQPPHALRGLHPRSQGRGRRADRNRLAPVLQGTACQAEVGSHLPLRLSRRQTRGGRLKLLRPLQARATYHDPSTIEDRAARSGTGLVSGLKSIPAGSSNIFLLPRLVRTSKGTKFRGSCHSPARL